MRGKRPEPTEFGQKLHLSVVNGYTFIEQTCWNNFNEGKDLPQTVENYFRRNGCYPTAVLADKLYQTRENRNYCKARGIRLSGPALGRKSKAAKEENEIQMYRDACERNVVEGKNGTAKRRYDCTLRYCVPENDKGIRTSQRIDADRLPTRSSAREYVAEQAVRFLTGNGLWKRLDDAGIRPEPEDSSNQLQDEK